MRGSKRETWMSKLLCNAIWITSESPIWRVGFEAVLAPPTIAAAEGALVLGGVWADAATALARSAITNPVFRIEERSMIKLGKFVKAMYWAVLGDTVIGCNWRRIYSERSRL